MTNKIYKSILERKLENFVSMFAIDSNSIFKNEKSQLIHPGEFGKYREECCKEIFKLLLKKDYEVDSGFIITSNNCISTQCDIVIYNSQLSPLISKDIAKIFPIEEVKIIGEIKSNLSLSGYKEALVKLAKNKALYEERTKNPLNKRLSSTTYDTIGSFLICNKLEFNYLNISYESIYGDIPRKYWHNAILSIEDGSYMYELDFRNASKKTIESLVAKNYVLDRMVIFDYPLYYYNDDLIELNQNFIKIDHINKFNHISGFFVSVSKMAHEIWHYEHDPIEYLGLNGEPLFEEKK